MNDQSSKSTPNTPSYEKQSENTPRLGEIGLENFAPYLMNRLMGRYNASLRHEMASLGLTTPQMRSLAVLSVIDGILIGELAVYAVVEQSTLSRAIDALDREGLIRRKSDATDSRAKRIFLTGAGRTAFERLWPHMSSFYEQMFNSISRKDRLAFVGTLQAMPADRES